MAVRRLKFWGWGYADEAVDEGEVAAVVAHVAGRLGAGDLTPEPAPRLEDIVLRPPRLTPPESLAALCSIEPFDRVNHSYGKSYRDYVRTLNGDFPHPPDVVAFPRDEADIVDLLDWAGRHDAAVIPFGGGSGVVGGVEAAVGEGYGGVVTIDLRGLDKVLEVDQTSRAARIQAGAMGPGLERQLKAHGRTLRHFPQSFEFSTLGGWIATRAGGHFASLYTHIDDFVESLRVVTPAGSLESFRLPGSGAGPSPDRMFIGSEGALGIITEAWMRIQDPPVHRASVGVLFDRFADAAEAVRAIAQAGLYPSNCRLIDANEAAMSRAGDGSAHLVVLAFESSDHPIDAWMARALECARDHGGRSDQPKGQSGSDHRAGAAGAWRSAFMRMPYYRSALISRGLIQDTFETAITWDRFAGFHQQVMDAARDAVRRVTGHEGSVTCRFTHIYPDGPAPYFTFHGIGRKDALASQWHEIKAAALETVNKLGGTVTHHHAIGREHRPWYDRQRPDLFAAALAGAKRKLDPAGLLNPGVLLDPPR
ncbi:MAG: FAD-binding oxidoreductase [Alphaproteobacteria bacterium]|jgi:alkyldihydroxyacetonephosphate synthase|nr:FAD-binding oxidoreductase [Alphaproteobacteria bacterium]MDP6516491.1 FAD-binding oxidoreductase [Alphaproteobacteria bacterium]